MIWFNISKLEQKIIANDFSNEKAFPYFLAQAILFSITSYLPASFENLWLLFLNVTGEVLLVIWGSYALFKTNAAGDKKDFFQRYVALSFVMFIRVFIFCLLFLLVSGVIYEVMFAKFFASQEPSFQNIIADVMFTCMSWFTIWVYYMLLKNSFKRVAHNKKIEAHPKE